MAENNELTAPISLARLQSAFNAKLNEADRAKAQKLLISDKFAHLAEAREQEDANVRFVNALAALIYNYPADKAAEQPGVEPARLRYDKGKLIELLAEIDALVGEQVNEILHHAKFQEIEATWREHRGHWIATARAVKRS